MLFFSFSLISSCTHASFLKVKVTGFLSQFPLGTHQFSTRGQIQFIFFRLGGTCWASATAVAESKCGQMALGRTSCLSVAGNSSDICGVSGRTGGALPAPVFNIAGCNPPRDNIWSTVPAERAGQEMAAGPPLSIQGTSYLLAGSS